MFQHPLDPLSVAEIEQSISLLRSDPRALKLIVMKSRLVAASLHEPEKTALDERSMYCCIQQLRAEFCSSLRNCASFRKSECQHGQP